MFLINFYFLLCFCSCRLASCTRVAVLQWRIRWSNSVLDGWVSFSPCTHLKHTLTHGMHVLLKNNAVISRTQTGRSVRLEVWSPPTSRSSGVFLGTHWGMCCAQAPTTTPGWLCWFVYPLSAVINVSLTVAPSATPPPPRGISFSMLAALHLY